MHMRAIMCVWRSKDSSVEGIPSFPLYIDFGT